MSKEEAISKSRYLISMIAGILAIVIISGLLCYALPLSSGSIAILKTFHLPVAKAGNALVFAHAVSGVHDAASFRSNLNSAIEQAKLKHIAETRETRAPKGDYKVALAHWFYAQEDLNQATYAEARQIMDKIKAGESFGELALRYSTDNGTRRLDGDAGFLTLQHILPELQEEASKLPPGKTAIMPARNGIHIIRMEDRINGKANQETLYHLNDILLPGSDFNKWLTEEQQRTPVRLFVQ